MIREKHEMDRTTEVNNPEWLSPSKTKPPRPFGKHTPWVWSVELVKGCNLACWHCAARVSSKEGLRYMTEETWRSMFEVIKECTPARRLELDHGGEPSLHPDLLKFIQIAREISPTTQIQMFTNGVALTKGAVTHKQLFDAGVHAVYVDMYAPTEQHVALASAAGVEWYLYNKPEMGSPDHKRKAHVYYNDPNMKLIVLQDRPENRIRWRKVSRMSTFLNHIDWNASMKHGLVPVREPYIRRCNTPQKYAVVNVDGDYIFCCTDLMCESAGLLGNVKDGPEGFKEYWFGRLMQSVRRRLIDKDRAGIPYCSRCNCAFNRCDLLGLWPDGSFDEYWDGERWTTTPPRTKDDEVFADGWEKTAEVMASLPSKEEEDVCVRESKKLVIRTTETMKNKKRRGFGLLSKGDC